MGNIVIGVKTASIINENVRFKLADIAVGRNQNTEIAMHIMVNAKLTPRD
jgi:hypothetical protein